MRATTNLAFVATALAATATAELQTRGSGTSSGSLPTVTVRGNAFFAGNERFYIRGVDYQPGGSSDAADPFADVHDIILAGKLVGFEAEAVRAAKRANAWLKTLDDSKPSSKL